MKTQITQEDYIKANRKASREEEIRLYGKQIYNRHIIHKSKKQYNRRRDRKIPSFFLLKSLNKLFFLLYTYIRTLKHLYMYALIKGQHLLGIFTTKKLMKEACEIIIKDDYATDGCYGWYHFRYCKVTPNVISNPLVSLFTLHSEYFIEIENDPNTGEILKF